MAYILALRTLLVYVFLGLPMAVIIAPTLPYAGTYPMLFNLWIWVDRRVCTWAHGTKMRTISGYTGARMGTHKRFLITGTVINLLARCVGDGANHCQRADAWEIKNGYDK